ncbi:protein unc-13 [Tanacetum coccineum]
MPRFCTLLQLNKSAQITQHKLAWPFMQPVEIEGLGLRDYYDLMAFGSRNTFIPAMPTLTRCAVETKLHGVFRKKEKHANLQRRNSQVATINENNNAFGVPQLCTFELTPGACLEGIQKLCESTAYKTVFHDLSHSLWDRLYVGELSSSAIEPFLQDLEQNLMVIADSVNERVRTRLVAEIMEASFEGFLLVLLAGGLSRAFSLSRAFTLQDSRQIEDDFRSLKDLFWANGGLPMYVINNFSATRRDVIPLFRTETKTVIKRFRRVTLETYGSSAKSRLLLPATTGQWSPSDPNTLLRVLCCRNDDAALKFLKKTYNLHKKL